MPLGIKLGSTAMGALQSGGAGVSFPVTEGLVAYWKMDEESGTRMDSHGDNHLTSVNGVGSTTGKLGNAASLDRDSSQELTISSNGDVNITGALSMSFWLYLAVAPALGANDGIIGKMNTATGNRQYIVDCTPARELRFLCNAMGTNSGNNKILTGSAINTEQWYHVAVVYNPSTFMHLYLDGELDSEKTSDVPASLFDGNADFVIGNYDGTPANASIDIDEVALYNAALDSDDVTALYGGGSPPPFDGSGGGGNGGGEVTGNILVAGSSDEFVVGVPQNNGAFFDGARYWVFYQESGTLKCKFGNALDDMSQTGGDLVTSIGGNSKAYSILFGQASGTWYAWALVLRSGAESSNVYRWELTSGGLGTVSSHISDLSSLTAQFAELYHDYGSATVSRLYRITREEGATIMRAIDPDLTNDAAMNNWQPSNQDLPERIAVLELSDGYVGISSDCGNNAGTSTVGIYETVKASEGDAWGSESFEGFGDMSHADNTSHAGQHDICQLDDGNIYLCYLDDTADDYGLVNLITRGNAQASGWSAVSTDVIGSSAAAWHIALSTDGTDVWLFYVKNDGGSRDSAIYYRRYDVSEDAFDAEVKLADIQDGHTFVRMYTQWRASGEIVVAWSELGGGTYDLMAASVEIA